MPDFDAIRLRADFGGVEYARSHAAMVRKHAGVNPGYAVVEIPLSGTDENEPDEHAPTIAGVSGGPWTSILGNSPCQITGDGNGFFYGKVAQRNADLTTDTMSVVVEDGRRDLAKFTAHGSVWASKKVFDDVEYRESVPAIFNVRGEPNCFGVDAGGGGTFFPVFVHPRWGLGDGEEPPTELGAGGDKAMYWTPSLILQYLRAFFYSANLGPFKWIQGLPDWITWPDNLHEQIELENQDPRRKPEPYSIENKNLAQVLSDIFRSAGPFDLDMTHFPGGNEITAVRTRNEDGGGMTLIRLGAGDTADDLGQEGVVISGSVQEDFRSTFTRVSVDGDNKCFERRVAMEALDLDDNIAENGTGLIQGWSESRRLAAEQRYVEKLDDGATKARAFETMRSEFPEVGAAFLIDPELEFQAGSGSFSNEPFAKITRPILPELLTSFLDQDANTSLVQRLNYRRPIAIETWKAGRPTEVSTSSGKWVRTRFRIERIDDDGTIWIPSMADQKESLRIDDVDNVVTLRAVPLRMTVAIPGDTNLYAAYKSSIDTSDTPAFPGAELNGDLALLDAANSNAHMHIAAQGRYRFEERLPGSYPIPESAGGTEAPSAVLVSDTAAIEDHARRSLVEHGRVNRGGRFVLRGLEFSHTPGLPVGDLSNGFPINAIIEAVEWDQERQETTLFTR